MAELDPFDRIRLSLWKFRSEKRAIVFGTLWDREWSTNEYAFDTLPQNGSGHAMAIVGYTIYNGKQYLVVQNSFGDNGHGGRHLFSRKIINAMVPKYGAFMFADISPEQARYYQDNGIMADQSAIFKTLIALYRSLIGLYKALIEKKKEELGQVPSLYLYAALAWQESNIQPIAVGDAGNALGMFQIWKGVVEDVNRVYGTKWFHNSVQNSAIVSLSICKKYLAYWVTPKRLGRPVTDQDLIRCWNGGPNGYKNPRTLVYYYQTLNKLKMLESGTAPVDIINRAKQYNLI